MPPYLRAGTKHFNKYVSAVDVQFDKVNKLSKDFEPFRQLWITASDWLRWHDSWMNDALVEVDAEKVDKNVKESYKTIHKCVKVFSGIPGQYQSGNRLMGHGSVGQMGHMGHNF